MAVATSPGASMAWTLDAESTGSAGSTLHTHAGSWLPHRAGSPLGQQDLPALRCCHHTATTSYHTATTSAAAKLQLPLVLLQLVLLQLVLLQLPLVLLQNCSYHTTRPLPPPPTCEVARCVQRQLRLVEGQAQQVEGVHAGPVAGARQLSSGGQLQRCAQALRQQHLGRAGGLRQEQGDLRQGGGEGVR